MENSDYIVVSPYNGEERLYVALKEHPDVTILDIRMPKMDGMTMLSKLREDEWGKTANVIILTNLDVTDDILKGVVADQPTYYLIKSNVKPKTITDYIEIIFKDQKETAENSPAV